MEIYRDLSSCKHDCVLVDDTEGVYEMLQHLVESGDELPIVVPSTLVGSEVLSLINQMTLVEISLLIWNCGVWCRDGNGELLLGIDSCVGGCYCAEELQCYLTM